MKSLFAALYLCLVPALAAAQDKVPAPGFEGGKGWLNTDAPIKLADLKGKIVLIDFWTYCCINCHHVFPELKRLEGKYPKELVVIGVHSAKFKNEKETENIRQAILRHEIEHPVVNDADFKIFQAYGAGGWPHFTLIDPEGNIVGHASGEGNYELFVRAIDATIKKFDDKINRKPIVFKKETAAAKDGPLYFPGKIHATADRLFISDTNHHRIVITDHDGKVIDTVGGAESGFRDGGFDEARFFQPQGLAFADGVLYVADTENHSVRAVELEAKRVRTIVGNGKRAYGPRTPPGDGVRIPGNSPWDVAVEGDRLFIAMAGNHQIWFCDLKTGRAGPFSGSGSETLTDGTHKEAAFSQPSGLAIHEGKLYVADSEDSGIREVDLDPKGGVRTIVGMGLFKFGDVDGVGDAVRLQHALGVVWHMGRLFIADTYNHKIKVCDPKRRSVTTFLGDGKRGRTDGDAPRFYEPGGLAAWKDSLFIADANNHVIRVCDITTGKVRTLAIPKP